MTLATRLARTMTRTEINAWATAFTAAFSGRTLTDAEYHRARTLRNRGTSPAVAAQMILDERFI